MADYLNRREAAKYLTDRGLKYTRNTLQKLATVGGGPEYHIFGSRAVYTIPQLETWIAAKLSKPRRSTSELIGAAQDRHLRGVCHDR